MVDAAWNSESANYMDFRDVLIDIYCPKPVAIEAMSSEEGFNLLEKSAKNFAL